MQKLALKVFKGIHGSQPWCGGVCEWDVQSIGGSCVPTGGIYKWVILCDLWAGFLINSAKLLVGSTTLWCLESISLLKSPGYCSPSPSTPSSCAAHLFILDRVKKKWASLVASRTAGEAVYSLISSHSPCGRNCRLRSSLLELKMVEIPILPLCWCYSRTWKFKVKSW